MAFHGGAAALWPFGKKARRRNSGKATAGYLPSPFKPEHAVRHLSRAAGVGIEAPIEERKSAQFSFHRPNTAVSSSTQAKPVLGAEPVTPVQNPGASTSLQQKVVSSVLPIEVQRKSIDLQRRQQALQVAVNSKLEAGCNVMARSIVPPNAFVGDAGRFLMIACDFYAYGPENTLLLPATSAASKLLGLPLVSISRAASVLDRVALQISELRQEVIADHDRAARAIASGNAAQILQRIERQASYRGRLLAFVKNLAMGEIGSDAYKKHEHLFRAEIDAM